MASHSTALLRNRQHKAIQQRINAAEPTTLIQSASIVRLGDEAQDETEAAINRMKGLVGEAEEIGIKTAKQMDNQIEQLDRVGDKLGLIKEQNRDGRAKLRELSKGALRDRCIQIMLALILLLLVGNVALLITNKK
eukprot:GHVH01000336.1.p1 GENE.GHVH01000336.1~~GHVH01000336.1.p1  ORF type:complete len:136 (+),score=22.19 GHVH01000336.1:50-457(+)